MNPLPIGGQLEIFVSDVHRFGTDAVMLAHFSSPKAKEKICDLGTGCGIVPFLFSRTDRNADITAVDVQSDAIALVEQSCAHNQLTNIRAVCADLKTMAGDSSFDLVTMNPPYKTGNGGIKSAVSGIRIARHEILCTTDDIVSCAYRLLRYGGRLCMCQRPERLADVFCAMRAGRVEPKRLRMVQQRAGRAPMLILAEGVKEGRPGMITEAPIVLEDDRGNPSSQAEEIYALYRQAREEN